MSENDAVGVADGDVLGEGEPDGGVSGGEGGDLDGVDGEIWLFGFDDCEVDNEDYYDEEDQEDCGESA